MKKLPLLLVLLSMLFACNKDTVIVRNPVTPAQDTPLVLSSAYKLRYQIVDSGGFSSDHHNGYSSWSRPVNVWDSLIADTTSEDPASRYLLIGSDTFRFLDSSLTILSGNKISGYGYAAHNHINPDTQPPMISVSNNAFTINYTTYTNIGGMISGLIIKGSIYP